LNTGAAEPLIDCHVHLWTHERPQSLHWIKPVDPVPFKNMLPSTHEIIAKANGVTSAVLVHAEQSLADHQWNLDISAHNPQLYRGVVGNLSEIMGTDVFAPLFRKLSENHRYLGYRL
jgi:predicted TIM-barrel fold metal-dependent hydrolase